LLQLAVNYRWSDIVFDERGPAGEDAKLTAYGIEGQVEVHAGDRAPDAPVTTFSRDESTTLHGIFTPTKHTALVFVSEEDAKEPEAILSIEKSLQSYRDSDLVGTYFVADSAQAAELVARAIPNGMVLLDDGGHARQAYGVSRQSIIIIRPDEVVGAYVFGAEGVNSYLARVFLPL
jgi:hypothetical protein